MNTTIFLFIGTTELILIAAIALLLFGGKKLPEMMRGLGQGIKQFKEGMNENVQNNENDKSDIVKKDESEEKSTELNDRK